MPRPIFLKLGQNVGFKSQRGHTEEEIPDAVSWNNKESPVRQKEGEAENEKPVGMVTGDVGRWWCEVGDVFMLMCVWLPPDFADTAQYSALISSESLMASCSMRAKRSGDWGVKYTQREVEESGKAKDKVN